MSRAGLPALLTATSAITAVGDGVDQTAASIRARVLRLREHASYEPLQREDDPEDPRPLVVASVDGVDPELEGAERLLALLIPALGALMERGGLRRRDLGRAGLLVALPAPDAVVARWDLGEALLPALLRRTGLSFVTARVSQEGHAGALSLLGEAAAQIAAGELDRCVVAGVDSYLDEARLSMLDEAWRLKSKRGVDGLCPGEAAAALLLEGERAARARGAAAEARIEALGLGREPSVMSSDRPSTGRGLTEAIQGALGNGRAEWAICDLNGESYRAFEWGIAAARLGEQLGGLRRLTLPAISVGDVGAATGALYAAAAAAALRRGTAPADAAIVWAGSDGPLRAAARVGRA